MSTETTDPTRYFLGSAIEPNRWVEVTKADFIRAEHAAGFHGPRRDEPATAGFSGSGGSEGTVRYDGSLPDGTVIELVKATAETTPTGTPGPVDVAAGDSVVTIPAGTGQYRVCALNGGPVTVQAGPDPEAESLRAEVQRLRGMLEAAQREARTHKAAAADLAHRLYKAEGTIRKVSLIRVWKQGQPPHAFVYADDLSHALGLPATREEAEQMRVSTEGSPS